MMASEASRLHTLALHLQAMPGAVAAALLAVYQLTLGPWLGLQCGFGCRFEPSCSRYAREAIAVHGLVHGGMLAVGRLCRCHPLGGHGYDPVPPKGASWTHES